MARYELPGVRTKPGVARLARRLHLVAAASVLIGCAAQPPAVPARSADDAGIAVGMVTHGPMPLIRGTPDLVIFARIHEEDGDQESQDRIFLHPSNYSHGRYHYLLGARPGLYRVIATYKLQDAQADAPNVPGSGVGGAAGGSQRSEFMSYLPAEIVSATTVRVRAQEVVFLGNFSVDHHAGLKDLDDAQLRHRAALHRNMNTVLADTRVASMEGVSAELPRPSAGRRHGGIAQAFTFALLGKYEYRDTTRSMKTGPTAFEAYVEEARDLMIDGGWGIAFLNARDGSSSGSPTDESEGFSGMESVDTNP